MGNNSVPPRPTEPDPIRPWVWPLLLLLLLMAWFATNLSVPDPTLRVVPYSEIKEMIREGAVAEVLLEEDTITAVLRQGEPDGAQRLRAVTPPQIDPDLLPLLDARGIEVTALASRNVSALWFLLPWVVIIGFYIWLSRRMTGAMRGPLGDLLGGRFVDGRAKDLAWARKLDVTTAATQFSGMSQTGLQGATRVMTWNIHGGVGPDRRCDLDRVIDVVRRHAPDVVALQEIDSRPSHTPGAFELLSEALGEHRVEARIIASGDGHYGHTLLSRWPIRSSRLHDLSFRMREPRAAIEATVATPGGALHIVATHLGLTRAERRHQAKRLGELADHDRSPTIMLGDFNDWWLGGHVRKALARRYPAQVRRRTFPARLPLLALDRLHCAAHVEVVRAWTDAAARSASDHLPLIADIILEPRQPTPS